MVIRIKDGTIYKLQAPNPIMMSQELWEDYTLHNFNAKPVREVKEVVKPIVAPVKPKVVEEEKKINKIFVNCLPGERVMVEDNIYNETKVIVNYGKPFGCEVVLVNNSDLIFQVWTHLDVIKEGSILFRDKRWWKVQERAEKGKGFLLSCTPSDEKPVFEG
jgi:hypothetical protein